MEISKVPFGTYKGEPVTKYILTNDNGVQVGILDFAGCSNLLRFQQKMVVRPI